MLTIEMRDGKLLKMWNSCDITEYDSTDLISELNSYLNNGWKLISIENGIYSLEGDESQLIYVDYFYYDEELEEVIRYCKVMTHADAYLIRQYLNCEVSDGEYTYNLNERYFELIDLRFYSDDSIKYYKDKEIHTESSNSKSNLLEMIKEDISCS